MGKNRIKELTIYNFHTYNTSPIWHDYRKWEDFNNGMYNTRANSEIIKSCIDMFNSDIIYWYMTTTIENWKYTSEVHLTQKEFNRKAWLGQATCNYHFGATIKETTNAWFNLSREQRNLANKIAEEVIEEWEYENFFGQKCI